MLAFLVFCVISVGVYGQHDHKIDALWDKMNVGSPANHNIDREEVSDFFRFHFGQGTAAVVIIEKDFIEKWVGMTGDSVELAMHFFKSLDHEMDHVLTQLDLNYFFHNADIDENNIITKPDEFDPVLKAMYDSAPVV